MTEHVEIASFVWMNLKTFEISSPLYTEAELLMIMHEMLDEEKELSFDALDDQDAMPPDLSGPDWGRKLMEIMDLQDRMKVGMEMIQAETQRRNRIYNYKRKTKQDWANFHDAKWTVRRYWQHWNKLKDQCMAIIGDATFLWAWYFKHLEEPISPYWDISDTTAIDNLEEMQYGDVWNCYADAHVAEMAEYDKD